MTKRRAFVIHLTASVLVMLALFAVIRWIWYPAPYFTISGGWPLLQIMAGVDVVLGPILTWIVFKPGKPGLRFDMSVIVGLQLVALTYGAAVVHQQRPLFTVFAVDRFTAIPAADVDPGLIQYPELSRAFGIGPTVALARLPDEHEAREQFMFEVFDGAKDLEYRADFYQPYRPDLADLKRRSLDIGRLAARHPETESGLKDLLVRRGGTADDYLYFPLVGNNKDIILVLSSADGQPLDWIDGDPWSR
ncbi:TfpX/TfpZ family type IV pilin accessory protein [Thiocystis violacea]|uniref:TfpX/TfpZ family type IV pilin accessory protein n=1 Tax=Thiocystis violacea TaxID=13725 RepID=UPI001907C906|nr:TfpX/TfpZ family type IV pilin accessory protein [Thiocystis violacea]MBK1718639.1 hypothetical protein [Thiocystis violacea]